MQTERTFLDDLKYQYNHGGMTIRLLMFNAAVFIVIQILLVFAQLLRGEPGAFLADLTYDVFTLHRSPSEFIFHPWGIFTSIFAHFKFLHFVLNMLFLYSAGRLFEQIFDQKRLLYTYILGGIAGGLLEIISYSIVKDSHVVVGASGSIMAIFTALAFYRPNLTVSLFGVLDVRIIILAALFILYDLISLPLNDGTAHFAHLGGVILGMISINRIHSSSNIITATQNLGDRIIGIFKPGPKLTVKKGGKTGRPKTDEEFISEAKERQAKTDAILDKISKSGYESLTKAEKDFLFQQSKK